MTGDRMVPSATRMQVLPTVIPLLIVASSATAEVCDKVAGDGWMPDQGPINTLTATRIVGCFAAFALVVVVVALLQWRWLAWMAAVSAALLAILPGIIAFLPGDEFIEAAIKEGCWAEMSTLSASFVALAFASAAAFFVWMTRSRFMPRLRR